MNKHLSVIAAAAFGAALVSSAQAASYKVVEVTNGGAISGKVTFTGKDPDPKIFAVTKNLETCGSEDRLIDYVKVNNGALTNVVVYLSKVKQGKPFPDSIAAIEINQKGCAFDPFLQVMANGGSDNFADHVGQVLNFIRAQLGFCDAHTWPYRRYRWRCWW